MGTDGTWAVLTGALLVDMITGYWLSRLGRPLNSLVVTLHKLIGLGAGVTLVILLVQGRRGASLGAGATAAAVVTGVLLLLGAATGGVLSAAKSVSKLVLRLHQVFPFLAIAAAAVVLWLVS
jgi:hypothetical protein